MGSKVFDKDKGWKALLKALEPLTKKGSHVKVGVQGVEAQEKNEDGISNVALAVVHELGTRDGHIPARQWIGGTYDQNKRQYTQQLAANLRQVVDGKITLKQALGTVGAKMAADIKRRVKNGEVLPNAPSTRKRKERKGGKGPVRALIDTGRMVNSVTWDVVISGEGKANGH